jgi:hypothetical protein
VFVFAGAAKRAVADPKIDRGGAKGQGAAAEVGPRRGRGAPAEGGAEEEVEAGWRPSRWVPARDLADL